MTITSEAKPEEVVAKALEIGVRQTSAPLGTMMWESWADMVIKAGHELHYSNLKWLGESEREAARSRAQGYIQEANARSA